MLHYNVHGEDENYTSQEDAEWYLNAYSEDALDEVYDKGLKLVKIRFNFSTKGRSLRLSRFTPLKI